MPGLVKELVDGQCVTHIEAHGMLALITGYSQGSLGFRLRLQLAHCAYLLTLSKYFTWGQTFRLWMKSEASLHMEGSIGVMKLGVQPSESAFGVDFQGSKGEVLEYKYMAGAIV